MSNRIAFLPSPAGDSRHEASPRSAGNHSRQSPKTPRRRQDPRQRQLLFTFEGGIGHDASHRSGGESFAPVPAESFEQRLLQILAEDLAEMSQQEVAELGDCTAASAKNLRGRRHLCRVTTFLRLLGGRANMAVEILRELQRRGLLSDAAAGAMALELHQMKSRRAG